MHRNHIFLSGRGKIPKTWRKKHKVATRTAAAVTHALLLVPSCYYDYHNHCHYRYHKHWH